VSPLLVADAILDEAEEAGVVLTPRGMKVIVVGGDFTVNVERVTVGRRSDYGTRFWAEGPSFQYADSPWAAARAAIPMIIHRRVGHYHKRMEKGATALRTLRWSARASMIEDLEFESMEEAPFGMQLDDIAVIRDTRQGNTAIIGIPRGGSGHTWAVTTIKNNEITGLKAFLSMPEAVRDAIVTIIEWRVREPT
jgi:hypothetical protein